MIQIQGIDRVDLTHRVDDVRQRIAAIEDKFGIGGDFQTALNRELNKGIIAQAQQVQAAEQITEPQKLLDGTRPVNEADAINSAKVAEAINSANKATQPVQNPVQNPVQRSLPGAEALPGRIMQNNINPNAAISAQNARDVGNVDENLFEADEDTSDRATSEKVELTATKYGVEPKLATAIAIAESNFDQSEISDAGAIGVMQLMPDTARSLGVNPYDEDENIDGGVRFLKQMLDKFDGNVPLAVAAYNAGPGAVQRYGGIPPYGETQAYVKRVMNLYQ